MTQDSQQPSGPAMICATDAIKVGPGRVGHLFGNVSLPRTVELSKAIAVLVGAIAGLLFASIVPADSMQKWVFGATFGGVAGWMITSYSPLRDESMLTWLGLQARTLTRQRQVDGKPVVVAVGVAPVNRETLGRVRVERSSVRVPAGRYDERGVLISAGNHNVPDGSHVFGAHVFTRPAPLAPLEAPPVSDPTTALTARHAHGGNGPDVAGSAPQPVTFTTPTAAAAPVAGPVHRPAPSTRPRTLAERRGETPGGDAAVRPARSLARRKPTAPRLRRHDQGPRP